MSVNLFFGNGFISVLAACFLTRHLDDCGEGGRNVICIERNGHVDPAYYQALEVLLQGNPLFHKVVRADCDFRCTDLRKPREYLGAKYYYRRIARGVAQELRAAGCDRIGAVWVPTTSRLWPFFRKGGCPLNLMEHGIGEYAMARSALRRKGALTDLARAAAERVLGYRQISPGSDFSAIWLCSDAVAVPDSALVRQHNFREYFADAVDSFWRDYRERFPQCAAELCAIRERIGGKGGYLYLPSDEIRFDAYQRFVAEQFSRLGIAPGSPLVIKKHPGATGHDYQRHLEGYGEVVSVSTLRNCYLPAEFIARILGVDGVIGSCSSALYYIRSWMPEKTLKIYNGFAEELLTFECRNIKSTLRELGLLAPGGEA